jgi:hypothetical protein
MGTLLFLVGLAATIVGLCVAVYGVSHGETKPIAIGGVMALVAFLFLFMSIWLG